VLVVTDSAAVPKPLVSDYDALCLITGLNSCACVFDGRLCQAAVDVCAYGIGVVVCWSSGSSVSRVSGTSAVHTSTV
jgi:hypothetical protein